MLGGVRWNVRIGTPHFCSWAPGIASLQAMWCICYELWGRGIGTNWNLMCLISSEGVVQFVVLGCCSRFSVYDWYATPVPWYQCLQWLRCWISATVWSCWFHPATTAATWITVCSRWVAPALSWCLSPCNQETLFFLIYNCIFYNPFSLHTALCYNRTIVLVIKYIYWHRFIFCTSMWQSNLLPW
jgi:hypothetical protein